MDIGIITRYPKNLIYRLHLVSPNDYFTFHFKAIKIFVGKINYGKIERTSR